MHGEIDAQRSTHGAQTIASTEIRTA